ncbi:hypothetical protein T09_13015, partial [Trichinella sp. T9]
MGTEVGPSGIIPLPYFPKTSNPYVLMPTFQVVICS